MTLNASDNSHPTQLVYAVFASGHVMMTLDGRDVIDPAGLFGESIRDEATSEIKVVPVLGLDWARLKAALIQCEQARKEFDEVLTEPDTWYRSMEFPLPFEGAGLVRSIKDEVTGGVGNSMDISVFMQRLTSGNLPSANATVTCTVGDYGPLKAYVHVSESSEPHIRVGIGDQLLFSISYEKGKLADALQSAIDQSGFACCVIDGGVAESVVIPVPPDREKTLKSASIYLHGGGKQSLMALNHLLAERNQTMHIKRESRSNRKAAL